ncbi:MAG: HAD family hydrolase [Candidatus Thorarchaeota archaeon]|nr:HAD family hydrolase [Candidatus Thorarchaeota archaeon]
MLRAAVFDLDGTITKLTLPLDAMRRDTKNYFLTRGLPPHILDPDDGISSSTQKARAYFLSRGLSEDAWLKMEREVDDLLSRHEGLAANGVELIEGALSAVHRIRGAGLKTAILTNNGRVAVNMILQRVPLDEYFDIIQTRNESPSPKPFPEGIVHLLTRLGVRIDEAVYVGDARIDAAAAARAGIEFIGVATGETSAEVLRSVGATHVFLSLESVADHILGRLS